MLVAKKYTITFNRCTRLNPNFIVEVDEPKRLIRRFHAPNESSYHMARASRDTIRQEAKIIEAWTIGLWDRDV